MDIRVILSVFLSVCVCKTHGQEEQQLGDLTFVCKEGWSIYQADCYMEVNVPMKWEDAKDTCHRQGGSLLWLKNEMEYDYVSSIATTDMYWTGLWYSGGSAEWSYKETDVNLKTLTFWANNEPNEGDSSAGYEACGMGQGDLGLAFKPCSQKHAFFCKYEACLAGQIPCATGGGCYAQEDKCDGRNDCEDMSDERDCRTAEYCSYYYKLTGTSANFQTANIVDGTRCSYMLEAPIGKRIKLSVPGTTLEKDIAVMEILTGSPNLQDATLMARLTGQIQQNHYISTNNFITVLLIVGDMSSSRNGITLSWTTDITEIFDGVKMETVDDTWRSLSPPFTQDNTPMYLHLSWKMEAPERSIIMYYLESYVQSEETYLRVSEGDMEDSPVTEMAPENVRRNFYASAASTIQVDWNSGGGKSSFTLKYKTGCDIVIDKVVGYFQVPVFSTPTVRYPREKTCVWTLTGGQAINRGLGIEFIEVQLAADPRLNPVSTDSIELYLDEAPSKLVSAAGSYNAPNGSVTVEFKSDLIFSDGVGFKARFSVDCPVLEVSDETLKSTETTFYGTDVTLSCQIGYKFDAEEYHTMTDVTLHCAEAGVWTYNGKTDFRIPNCAVVQCGVPNEIQNGYIRNVTGTSYDNTVEYECNDGFQKSHYDSVQCNADGTWHNVPTCTSATCQASDIEGVSHGYYRVEAGNNITQSTVDFNTIVKFECDPGYELRGSLRTHCRENGWSDPKPECTRVLCPLPEVENAQALSTDLQLEYESTEVVSCQSGYGINGSSDQSVTVTCQGDRKLAPPFVCSDINECDTSPCDLLTTRCENNDGSYQCVCLEGFQEFGSMRNCTDILECNVDNGGCSHGCQEVQGSYYCTCDPGWTLFTENGIHEHRIPDGETGYRFRDEYYFNHTCVRVSCERPASVIHGTLLSSKSWFHYEDTLDLVCEDGYHITGLAETETRQTRTCGQNGWDYTDFTCSARTCTAPAVPNRGTYSRTSVNFGEEIVLTCQWNQTTSVTRHVKCIYDSGITRLGGDDITACPEINCGSPDDSLPDGSVVVGQYPASNAYLDSPTFTFGCDTGFLLVGQSEMTGDTSVTCKENGRWSFGTLRCLGKTCSDPGTPAEATQVVTNYERGQVLYYTCNRDGYEPDPKINYTCNYNQLTDTAEWSDNLETNLPECKDTTKPVIHSLPSETIYKDIMIPVSLPVLSYTDNFGVSKTTASDPIRPGDITTDSITITYTAEDYDGNVAMGNIVIEVIDRNIKPSLTCPPYLELSVTSSTTTSYDIKQNIISDGTMQLSQEFVTVSVANIGTHHRINVTAENQFNTEAYCSFLVTFKAAVCFEETLYPDANAIRSCGNNVGSDGTMTCTSTCKTGYLYGDGTKQKSFSCSGQNVWGVNYPHVFCLPTESPAYHFRATVIHEYGYLTKPCLTEYQAAIAARLNTFESQMSALTDCNGIVWDITYHTTNLSSGSTRFQSAFTVELKTTAITDDRRSQCIEAIKSNKQVFNLANNILYCTNAATNVAIVSEILTATAGEFDCPTTTYRLHESTEEGKKCLPCGPGQEYDETVGNCISCPDDQYQDAIDGTCRTCDTGQTPNMQQTDCIITCPAGFVSADGLFPCTPCSLDNYWENSKICSPCPSGTSTSGREGATAVSGCYASCAEGSYSVTGYIDMTCHPCPQNFYQPDTGTTSCIECPVNQVTDATGQTNISYCHDYIFSAGESCNSTYCNNHGTCSFGYHRPICTCYDGYQGNRCEISFHICDSNYNPCMNEATCVPGNTYRNYTCQCGVVNNNDLCFSDRISGKEGGYDNTIETQTGWTLLKCQTECLNNDECRSLSHYTLSSGLLVCLLYDETKAVDQLTDRNGSNHYNKNCPPVFGGVKCEKDLIDGCANETNQCSEEAMCKDTVVINGYECLCPSLGGYEGEYCDQTQSPCSSSPCMNQGTCHDFERVRYECTCRDGFTGMNCETDIDECQMNPGACLYGGSCNDGIDGYTCSCTTGFSGANCETTPNYCTTKVCLGVNPCYNSLDEGSGICECEGPDYEPTNSSDYTCQRSQAEVCDYVTCVNGMCNAQGKCDCEPGFTGSLCQHSKDDCTETLCVHGQCKDLHQDTQCLCEAGYTGDRCETNVDDCWEKCGVHGTCVDGVNSYICHCEPGFTGTECETEIDECLSNPCQHGGNCTDQINGYQCSCMTGWIGDNCEDWNNLCIPSPCQNNGICYTLTQERICRCFGGTQGDNCEGLSSVCNTIGHTNVCLNGGMCEDEGGTASCSCADVPDINRCFGVPHDGLEGGNENEIEAVAIADLQSCKQKCLNNAACESLSFFSLGSTMFCKTYSVALPNSLSALEGSQHFEKNCPTDYAGVACEQVKDWCATSPCQNGGQCTTLQPKGFECQCNDGYSGNTCEIAANPCASSTCPTESMCRSSETEYYCQCPEGREILAGDCRAGSGGANLILLLADATGVETVRMRRDSHISAIYYSVPEDIPILKTAFRMSGETFSVMLWVRVHNHSPGAAYNLLRLVGSEQLFPLQDTDPKFVLLITNSEIKLTYDMTNVTLYFDPLEKARWYHIGVALSATKEFSYTIDAVEVSNPQILPNNTVVDFGNLNAQIVLGDTNMVVEFNRVSVWQTALSNSDFAQALVEKDYQPSDATLTQGWWNYKLTKATKILTAELSPAFYSEDKSQPLITCDETPYTKVSTERIVRRSALGHLTAKINEVANNSGDITLSIPADLTWGYYSGVVVVRANMRTSVCRFPVYIKYYNTCPAPVDDSDVTITHCNDGNQDGICGLQCTSNSAYISAPTPKYKSCGVLGVYDWKMPYTNPVLPTCAAGTNQKYVVEITMQYQFSINCAHITGVTTKLENEIRTIFHGLNQEWRDICIGDTCTNLKFKKVECNAAVEQRADIQFYFTFDSDKLFALRGGVIDGQVKLDDALSSIIVIEKKVDLSRYASAQLMEESVVVTMKSDCTTTGYNLINGICVPCGKGLVYSEESGRCEFCPKGTYKGETDVDCQSCGSGMTTVNIGTTNQDKCIDECEAGRFYNVSKGSCQSCARHYYQDQVGQSFCLPCKIGYKTTGEGSDSQDDCKEDCAAGFERDAMGACVMCSRGYWRDLLEDDCQQCDLGTTTIPGEVAVSRARCSMDTCAAGTYWDKDEGICKDCPVGHYQDIVASLVCKPCDGNKTTRGTGQGTQDDCVFYCAPGYEVNITTGDSCVPCQRGYYKDNDGESKFDPCKQCDASTTDDIAADSSDLCEYEICESGQHLENKVCIPCVQDFYQPVAVPTSAIQCIHCPDNGGTQQGTLGIESASESDCKPICQGGQYFNGVQCVDCAPGSYKPDTDRFGNCISCPENFTTDVTVSTKKMNASDCYIPLCKAGDYIKHDIIYTCSPCDVDTYQPNEHPNTEITCTACPSTDNGVQQGTRSSGADSVDVCEPVCPGGEEYNQEGDVCNLCPVGKYKQDTLVSRFMMCNTCPEGFVTDGQGKMSSDDCEKRDCDPGSYDNGVDCIPCDYGYYQEQRTQTSCVQCGPNLNTSRMGSTSRQECQAFCGAGLQTTEDQTGCVPCPEGYFKPSPSYDPCTECVEDYTSNEPRTACPVLFCSPGKEHVLRSTGEAECVPCEIGQFKSEAGNAACSSCPAGKTNNETGQKSCDLLHCEPGKYAKNGVCEVCAIGSYKAETGNQVCTPCPSNKTTAGNGSVSENSCTIVVCEPGYYREPSQTTSCTKCPLNQYQDLSGQTSCKSCGNGKVTMQTGSANITQCVTKCKQGEQYNSASKECEPCPQRYYKEIDGNFEKCKECPLGNTTVGTGSISAANCTQGDCNAGAYVTVTNNQVTCIPCPKGQYQPERSQTACLLCADGKITPATGSSRETQCVVQCPAGEELIYMPPYPESCTPCPIGMYNDAKGAHPNRCKDCPPGLTTTAPKQPECLVKETEPRPQPYPLTVVFAFVYRVNTDCTQYSLGILTGNIKSTIISGMNKRRSRYTGLCGFNQASCGSITVSIGNCIPDSRRKREINSNVEVAVTMPNISSTVVDMQDNNNTLQTKNLVVELFEANPEDFSLPTSEIVYGGQIAEPAVTPVCEPGYMITGESCTACQLGHYLNDTSRTCLACAENHYQDETAQTACKMCPDLTYYDSTGATSVSDCKHFCTENPNYCNSHGTCSETGRTTATCTCNIEYVGDHCETMKFCHRPVNQNYCNGHGNCSENGLAAAVCTCDAGYFGDHCQELPYCTENPDYCSGRGTCIGDNNNNPTCLCNPGFSGARCENKETPTSNNAAIIGGVVGGVCGILTLILIIVGVYKCLMRHDTPDKKQRHPEQEEPEYYHNPVYDNRGYYPPGDAVPAVFSAHPAMEYYGNDPFAEYSISSKHARHSHSHSEARPSSGHLEDQYVWQA